MSELQLDLDNSPPAIAGLQYIPGFVDASEEVSLLREIDVAPWLTDLSRRVQHYGWKYDYRARRVTPDSRLGPLPQWLQTLGARLEPYFPNTPDQVIVNEYEPGQGIASHTDCVPCFGPVVAMLSLGSDVQMDFARSAARETICLRQRSLLVLSDDARTQWEHSIAKRRADRQFGVRRQRRISLTFRTVQVS
jgi:alkylated DNA repair dioxygenase AlkB